MSMTSDVERDETMLERILCPYFEDVDLPRSGGGHRHCSSPKEQNSNNNSGGDNSDDTSGPKPSREECEADEQGNFGSGVSSSLGVQGPAHKEEILFHYQVQTSISHRLDHKTLADLEKALSDELVPELFEGIACEVRKRKLQLLKKSRSLQLQQQQQSPTGLTGLASAPDDVVAPGIDGGTYYSLVRLTILGGHCESASAGAILRNQSEWSLSFPFLVYCLLIVCLFLYYSALSHPIRTWGGSLLCSEWRSYSCR